MGAEKSVRERHEYASLQLEGLLHISPPRSPAIYRREFPQDPETGPVLHCGQKCVVRVSERNRVLGYLLCRIISWAHPSDSWSARTTIYFAPEAGSNEAMDVYTGTLMHGLYGKGMRYYGNRDIISFDPADMPERRAAA